MASTRSSEITNQEQTARLELFQNFAPCLFQFYKYSAHTMKKHIVVIM